MMMKKLNWSGLDFLRRGDRTSPHQRQPNNSQLSSSNQRWNSESRLLEQSQQGQVSQYADGSLPTDKSRKHRASFCDLLASSELGDSRGIAEGRSRVRTGLLDTLKRKFNRMARSEHSKLKQIGKRHSISISVPPVEIESAEDQIFPKSQTFSSAPREPCQLCQLPSPLRRLRKNCCEAQNLPSNVNDDDDNDNIFLASEELQETTGDSEEVAETYMSNENENRSTNVASELSKLVKYGWYWGRMTRGEAERKLAEQPDGAFLVRDSSDDCHLLSLSFRSYGRTLHTRIEHSNGYFSFYAYPEAEQHRSVSQLIEHLMDTSRSGIFCYSRSRSPGSPSYPVRLTKAVSRFSEVLSLQYMCRFVIRQYVRMDHIEAMPLPESLKLFIIQGNS